MKISGKYIIVFLFFTAFVLLTDIQIATAQNTDAEPMGRTFNASIGPGYFGGLQLPAPFSTINYEYEVAGYTTIAPFLGFASYRSAPQVIGGKNYYYRATILPVGIKATYYLDKLLHIPCRWDVYVAGSAGYAFTTKEWDYGYPGTDDAVPGITLHFLLLHLGAEYHASKRTGLFADVSTGVATFGFAIHGYN
jgi:hypothetical protein